MERRTLLFFNGIAVATTMLASVAKADDSSHPSHVKSGSQTTTTTTSSSSPSNPSIAPSSMQPSTTPQSGVQATTTTMGTTTTTPTSTPVGTTTLSSSDAAIIGAPAQSTSQDSVTVYQKTRPNPALLVTGGAILAGTYVTTAVVAGQSDHEPDKNLYIPVVGPWLNLADRQCSGCEHETRNVTLIVGSGILQGLGAGMVLASFLVPKKVEAATIQAGNVKMHVLPTQMGRDGAGVGAVGTF